jgi:hypothetical protein
VAWRAGNGERLRSKGDVYIHLCNRFQGPQQNHEVQTRGRGRKIRRRETKMKETNKSRGSRPSSSINSVKAQLTVLRIKYYKANSEICHRVNAFNSSLLGHRRPTRKKVMGAAHKRRGGGGRSINRKNERRKQ